MTGKELIVYILQNNLENEEVFKNGKLLGYVTIPQAAVGMGIGEAAVRALINLGAVSHVKIDDVEYVSAVDIQEYKSIDEKKVEMMYEHFKRWLADLETNGGYKK